MAGFTNDPFLVAYVGIVLERELSEECRTMTLACQLNRRDKSLSRMRGYELYFTSYSCLAVYPFLSTYLI